MIFSSSRNGGFSYSITFLSDLRKMLGAHGYIFTHEYESPYGHYRSPRHDFDRAINKFFNYFPPSKMKISY